MTTSIIFFGSDRFSAVVLQQLLAQKYPPTLVVTDSPKPQGRKQLITPNEVEIIANNQKLKVLYYQDNNEQLISYIKHNNSTGMAASFPHLFPLSIINAFGGKLYNLHPSLLPQYRNVAPGPYAIAMGDIETGITLQHIDEHIDTGSIIAQLAGPILPADTTSTLLTRLFIAGAKMFCQYLNDQNAPKPCTMYHVPKNQLVFTRKLKRESGYIEWDVVQKLLQGRTLKAGDTTNPLIKLRLTHHPERTKNILAELIRALDTYERVWTTVPKAELKRSTDKGDLNIIFTLGDIRNTIYDIHVLLPGKPKPITYSNFTTYYLNA